MGEGGGEVGRWRIENRPHPHLGGYELRLGALLALVLRALSRIEEWDGRWCGIRGKRDIVRVRKK